MKWITFIAASLLASAVFAQSSIQGTVSGGFPLENASVYLEETNQGTSTDKNGNFELTNVESGEYHLIVKYIGFKDYRKSVKVDQSKKQVEVELTPAWNELNELVVTGTKTQHLRSESPLYVEVIGKTKLENAKVVTLAEGLNFSNGLRMETDCQTCGYSQLRINGLGGSYSQILYNNRLIFNSLIGLYGLEQMPAQIIEQIEVIKGGASASYGSNAIGGTVNILTKVPDQDEANLTLNSSLINNQSLDNYFAFDFSKRIKSSGFSAYVNTRNRDAYDHNDDGFSELPEIAAKNFGLMGQIKTGDYSKLDIGFQSLNETRRGGNNLAAPPHKADQAEERIHDIKFLNASFHSAVPSRNLSYEIYLAGQSTKRKHYTGVDMEDAYGNTKSETVNGGIQLNHFFNRHGISYGLDVLYDNIEDTILNPNYNYSVNQKVSVLGLFIQDEWKLGSKTVLLAGIRMDEHNLMDNLRFTPRLNLMHRIGNFAQLRAYYTQGYRAPQAFDADLHIAFSGGGIAFTRFDPNLQPEYSNSAGLTLNLDKPGENRIFGFTIDAFYTSLQNTFVIENAGEDENGNTILYKTNGTGSTVAGVSVEGRLNEGNIVEGSLGFTWQRSIYDKLFQWSEQVQAVDSYLRTPDIYGYLITSINFTKSFSTSINGTFTGDMLVPRVALGEPGDIDYRPMDELVKTPNFFSIDILARYRFNFPGIHSKLELTAGVKNVLNNYQNDFDRGKYRDSNYVYGPAAPRSYLVSLAFNIEN